ICGAGYLSKTGIAHDNARLVELRGVGEIEELGAELPAHSLGHPELAEEGEVEIGEARTVEDISAKRAVSVCCRGGEGGRIKPLGPGANCPQLLELVRQVWPGAVARRIEAGGADRDIQWQPGVGREDSVQLPISQHPTTHAGIEPAFVWSKG